METKTKNAESDCEPKGKGNAHRKGNVHYIPQKLFSEIMGLVMGVSNPEQRHKISVELTKSVVGKEWGINTHPVVSEDHHGRWNVIHAMNGAILASCKTEEQAERTKELLELLEG